MLFILACVAISASLHQSSNYIDLSALHNRKDCDASIIHNPKGCHYLNPMVLQVKNKSTTDLYVVLSAGDIFIPSDTSCQNLVTTKSDTFFVKKNEMKSFPLAGMCIEPSDAGGRPQVVYKFLKHANDKLKQLAEYIASKNFQSSAAQGAVWSLVKNEKEYSIYSNNKDELIGLNRIMEKITGHKPKTEKQLLARSSSYYSPPVYENRYWGEFGFKQNNETNLNPDYALENLRGNSIS
ncbi:MAG: hypothetical protein HYZ42_14270 [Bacteroidetes bacterium]|nr:hypothetical protein [Bacteroidota bacterium]